METRLASSFNNQIEFFSLVFITRTCQSRDRRQNAAYLFEYKPNIFFYLNQLFNKDKHSAHLLLFAKPEFKAFFRECLFRLSFLFNKITTCLEFPLCCHHFSSPNPEAMKYR